MKLYHYTSPDHLPLIVEAGYLKLVESNISRSREHAGPDVVWLTSSPTPAAGHGLSGSRNDKKRVRFTVDVDRRSVQKWRAWAKARGIASDWMNELARAGGSGTWWVSERPIESSQWIEILDLSTGQPLATRSVNQEEQYQPTIPFLAYSWESQVRQYPQPGLSGIQYFKGDLSPTVWVDCLLYYDATGELIGILNHYPMDNDDEVAGSVNVYVRPDRQRQGIATQLIDECARRWAPNPAQQAYTPSGAALLNSMSTNRPQIRD
ncbi:MULTISPECIES: GNAT family N-acetyltransferase [unclassified Nocardioides]|uniref:GNAT family N-acetyltransferase n=1 Tax=unclassified Nocardioides TaxID=2615069 RepID=UPI001305363F|nr:MULTISPECIES: GNAT family N-acetyltransferase [unclassified Nocardioides]